MASSVRSRRGPFAALAALLLTAAIAACEGRALTETGPSVTTVLSAVATPAGDQGLLVEGVVPQSASGQTFSVSAPPAAVVGGTAMYTLTSTEPFQQAFVTIDGYEGYYSVVLPAPVTSVDLLVSFKQEQLYFDYNLLFNGVATGGAQGQPAFASTHLISVGTGDVQVSVFFDDTSDVDLHLVDPTGEHIFYGHLTSTSGGRLDLDANPGCSTNHPQINNENITFPTGAAPRGTYTVYLDYFAECGTSPTRYVITVAVKGQAPQVFSGTFVGTSSDSTNNMREITTFTY
jgi:hypothetical protein